MKKKIISAIITIVLIAIISTLIYIMASRKNNNFTNIKILDTYGTQIENYDENTLPFVIEKENEKTQIYLNGEEYKNGERIYKVGEYEILSKNGNKEEKNIIKINKVEKKEENTYKIYVISETLQTLLANLNISDDINQKGFLWTARTSTVNIEKIKKNIPNLKISQNNGELKSDEFKDRVVKELKEYIKTILNENPKAYFELYMEEDKFYLDLELFGKIGLDDSRYNVTMYTNGTLGYTREYEMTKKDKYERFNQEKEDYIKIVNEIKNNTLEINEIPGSYLKEKAYMGEIEINTEFFSQPNFDYMYISTLVRDNIKLLLQYPEMVIFEDEKVSSEMKEANIEKIVIQDEFNKLEENEKSIFFDNIDLNKDELDKNYFTEPDKEYLIITGTTPFYGEYENRLKFEKIIKQVVKDYGDKYVILYKPHPRELPNAQQEKFLNGLGIKILPGKLPMEAICFIYPNLKLGGFDSSLYMSTDQGKTLFFFAKDKTELWSPLDVLYDTVFKDAKFYE